MPKQKTKRSAAKRFKVTGSGEILREKAFRSHILSTKSRKRKRKLRKETVLTGADRQRIGRLIGA